MWVRSVDDFLISLDRLNHDRISTIVTLDAAPENDSPD